MNNQYIDTTSYTNKDFRSVWPELLELVTDLTDKWDPNNSNESDPGVALLKLKAFVADKLNYNIDKNVLEAFPSSVTQRGNAQKLYDCLGYQLKWYESAGTQVHFKFINPSTDSEITKDTGLVKFTIPMFAQICDSEKSVVYTTLEKVILDSDNNTQTEFGINVIEGPLCEYLINGNPNININNLDADYRLYFPESIIASNGIFINNIGSTEFWDITDNLESTEAGRKVFKFGVLPATNQCYIEFPQDSAELFDQGINIHYVLSSGTRGNIKPRTLTTFTQEYPNGGVDEAGNEYSLNKYIKVVNLEGVSSGADPESLESAYKNYQKTVNTFSTLVTLQDYNNAINKSNTVSKCLVTDRLTDFNAAYSVKTKSLVGESDKIMPSDNLQMNAFNLAIYPLNKVTNVYDFDTYSKTFKTSADAFLEATESIEDLKAIPHDWISPFDPNINLLAFLFKNKLAISGQLITYQKVSTTEADEIIKKIKTKIYETYQSKNLSYGQDLDLDTLLETIKNADTRIKAFIPDDFGYRTDVMQRTNDEFALIQQPSDPSLNENIKKLQTEIIARSILAGVTPLFIFDEDIAYNYTMKSCKEYALVSNDSQASTYTYPAIEYADNGSLTIKTSISTATNGKEISEVYNNISAITLQTDIPLKSYREQSFVYEDKVYQVTLKDGVDEGNLSESSFEISPTLNSFSIQFAAIPEYAPGHLGIYNSNYYYNGSNNGLYKAAPNAQGSGWTQIEIVVDGDITSEKITSIKSDTLAYSIRYNTLYRCKQAMEIGEGEGKLETLPSLENTNYWDSIKKYSDNIVDIIIENPTSDYSLRIKLTDKQGKITECYTTIDSYTLKENESVFIYAPSYISTVQLSTYLNIGIVGNFSDDFEISAGSLYQLKQDETLYVSEAVIEIPNASARDFSTPTRGIPLDSARINSQIKDLGKTFLTYPKGTIIKPSFNMSVSPKGGLQNASSDLLTNYVNLEASKTIDIMDANITQINKKTNDPSDISTKEIYCVWITDDLDNYLFTESDRAAANSRIEHILQQNEIFIYTDATKSDLILLESGTKLSIPYNSNSFDRDRWKMSKPSLSEINKNGLDALENLWVAIPRSINYFTVEELEIQTLGTGVTIWNTDLANPVALTNIPVTINNPEAIKWSYEKQEYNLPIISLDNSNDQTTWKAFSRLSLFSSPEAAFKLRDNQCACLFELVEMYNRTLDEKELQLVPKYALGPGQSFTTNYVTICSGGIKQDIRALTASEELKSIAFNVFDYQPAVNETDGSNKLWTINVARSGGTGVEINSTNINSYLGSDGYIKVTELSDGSYETQLKFNGTDFKDKSSISLSMKLSGLFNNSTIIPILVEGAEGVSLESNLPHINGNKDENGDPEALSIGDITNYHDTILYLNYVDPEGSWFTLQLGNVPKNTNVLVKIYPPKHYSKINESLLLSGYYDINYLMIRGSGENNTTTSISMHDVSQWEYANDYNKYDVVKYGQYYYVAIIGNKGKIPSANRDTWVRANITEYSNKPTEYQDCDIVYEIDNSKSLTTILEAVKELAAYKNLKGTQVNAFNYSYQVPKADRIMNPLEALSFYRENHICHNMLLSQIESINIKLARQSQR